MKKFLLNSILIATFWLPLAAARYPNPVRALKKLRKDFLIYCIGYVITIVYIIPRL